MWRSVVLAVSVAWAVASDARSQSLDVSRLAAAYKAYDLERQGGKGKSESADSGTLGWGEGPILEDYAALWEVTGDAYWLAKISEHFHRIMASASDPDGDGYLSWQTKAYSCAVAYAERLSNVSDARLAPEVQKNKNGEAAGACAGHTYLVEFPAGPDAFRILDRDTHRVVADRVPFKDGKTIAQIEPFRFQITGRPHQGDRFLVRTVAPEAIEYTVHQGMFVYPAALFIEAVKNRPDLQGRFGADAEEFLAFIKKNVLEKNEQDWLDLGDQGGGYRFQPVLTDRGPNRLMPHNQYATLARAWLVLKDLEGAPPLMARRAAAMVHYFHAHLELDTQRDAYRWHYADWIEYGQPGPVKYEDTGHARLNVGLAIEAARRGVIFTEQDMRRIANTWLKVMWNQDEQAPRMASGVEGRKPFDFSPLASGWTNLSQWDRRVYGLALKSFLAASAKKQTAMAPTILLSAHRAGALNSR